MVDENEATNTIGDPELEHVASTTAEHKPSDDGIDGSRELNDAIQGLPSNAVKELLSQGVSLNSTITLDILSLCEL